MNLSYEFHHVEDLQNLERLWQEATDWGDETLQALDRWFIACPFGKPCVVIAKDTDTDEIVGQFRFMPSRVVVNGRVVSAVRPFGTIVSPKMRQAMTSPNPFKQPAVAMYRHAVEELRGMGAQLIYMVPDPRWVRLFKMLPFLRSGTFPLWSLPLPLAAPHKPGGDFKATPLTAWDERVDKLWEASSRLHPCAVVRNAGTLPWKLGHAGYTVTTIERPDGSLAGLVAARRKGDRQWLICDMLFADAEDSLRATLSAAANVAHEQAISAKPGEEIIKVALLVTPPMQPVIESLGFKRDAYDFPIVVHVLDDSISVDDVSPAGWYVSAND